MSNIKTKIERFPAPDSAFPAKVLLAEIGEIADDLDKIIIIANKKDGTGRIFVTNHSSRKDATWELDKATGFAFTGDGDEYDDMD